MVRFREEQSFRQTWVFWAVAGSAAVCAAILWAAADRQPPAMTVWPPMAITSALLLWLMTMRLVTEVRDDCLRVKFEWLWPERRIPYADIVKATATTYRPILDYGGWGVRGFPQVRAFNVRGSRGVLLELRDGRRLMIGSQRPEELEAAIRERLMSH